MQRALLGLILLFLAAPAMAGYSLEAAVLPASGATDEQAYLFARFGGLSGENDESIGVLWTKVSGPGSVAFDLPTGLRPRVRFGASGTYVLRVVGKVHRFPHKPTYVQVWSGEKDVSITVLAPPLEATQGRAITVTAGPDRVITRGYWLNVITSNGGAGTGSALIWTLLSGPGKMTFRPAANLLQAVKYANTVQFDTPGVYVLRYTHTSLIRGPVAAPFTSLAQELAVSDVDVARDDVTITVK